MNKMNLERMRATWKDNPSFSTSDLAPEVIDQYRQKSSRDINKLFRSGLITDITLKVILLLSFILLLFIYLHQPAAIIISGSGGLVILVGMIYQLSALRKVPDNHPEEETIMQSLSKKIRYYSRWHIRTLFVSALTNALLIISGMLYYFYFKYGEIRPLELDDFIVLGAAPVLGFMLGTVIQVRHHNFHIRQIETLINDIDTQTFRAAGVLEFRQKRKRIITIYFLAFLTGLLLFLYFAFK